MPEQLESSPQTTSDLSAFAADVEMLAEFVIESREHLAAVEKKMLLIEKDTADMESINSVFRAVHTIKGLAGFLELTSIQQISHEVETLLDHARARRLVVTPPLVDAFFSGIDFIRHEVDRVDRQLTGAEPLPAIEPSPLMLVLRGAGNQNDTVTTDDPPIPAPRPESPSESPSTRPLDSIQPSPDDISIRIETTRLDDLMNAVGELVIANTLVSHHPLVSSIQDYRLIADLALLSRITADVKRITTNMRMVPIGNQFQKTARLVRNLSRQAGKQVELITSGEDTELDKTIADQLADPFLHMVRNSIDHGIESPHERELLGKHPTAHIRLAAYHQSAKIVIEISDDGRGLNLEKILAKAIERNIITNGTSLSAEQISMLIFEPGFSTAEKLTGLSGRGVGMDVVLRQVQKLRGTIDIDSQPGAGTTFFLRLPLTLAIIEGLVVTVGDSQYVLPLYSVVEIFSASAAQLSTSDLPHKTDLSHGTVLLRGSHLPVILLHQFFHTTPHARSIEDGILIASHAAGKNICLFVDQVVNKQEVVVKSLGDTFKGSPGLTGCAILADGSIGLILDVDSICATQCP